MYTWPDAVSDLDFNLIHLYRCLIKAAKAFQQDWIFYVGYLYQNLIYLNWTPNYGICRDITWPDAACSSIILKRSSINAFIERLRGCESLFFNTDTLVCCINLGVLRLS